MGGLKRRLPAVYWPFLAGVLCLAGFPGSGGFFSKDAILGAVFEKGGGLYGGLFALGLVTALLTSFYTFRMLFVVFHGASTPLNPRDAIESGQSMNEVPVGERSRTKSKIEARRSNFSSQYFLTSESKL